jgi:predicted Zn-ribbon and HTH transcriptional regulator
LQVPRPVWERLNCENASLTAERDGLKASVDRIYRTAREEIDGVAKERDALAAAVKKAAKALVDLGHCTHYPGFTCDADFPAACPECIEEWLQELAGGDEG